MYQKRAYANENGRKCCKIFIHCVHSDNKSYGAETFGSLKIPDRKIRNIIVYT